MSFNKFCTVAPSHQNAVSIFEGRWASKLPRHNGIEIAAGDTPLFECDPRPGFAASAFGDGLCGLRGMNVCELGPLEAAHTYQLEKLGADVLAIEGNAEAYLKCLVIKEIYGLRSRFFLGDFVKYLEDASTGFDLIFASGVLYHMTEPLKLIELICKRAPRAFIWTHYFDEARCTGFVEQVELFRGMAVPHYRRDYGDRTHPRFWGGLTESAAWLRPDAILEAFRMCGHSRIEVVQDDPSHPNGPAFSVVTSASILPT